MIASKEREVRAAPRDELCASHGGKNSASAPFALLWTDTLPVLELEDGTLIAECTAITEYLDALDGAPTLTGRTPLEKGLIHMMSKRAELELLDAISVYFHHATPGLGAHVELYQNAEWGIRQRDKALRGMHYVDGILRKQPFVTGDYFSMADITVIGGLIFAGLVELPVPAECKALAAWYAKMLERPSVKNRITMSESMLASA